METAVRSDLDACLRGFYRLFAYVQDEVHCDASMHIREARVHELRLLQHCLVENLAAFLSAEASAAEAALRADVMDALARISLRFTGRAFESFSQPAPGAADLVHRPDAGSGLAFEAYRSWLDGLIARGQVSDPDITRVVEQRTLLLLPVLDASDRAPIVQQLYDAGLIFNLTPRISLTGAYLSRADLTEAPLARAHLAGANLRGARLAGAVLNEATLYQATLITAQLGCALLYGADIREAEVAGAGLFGADLRHADLAGANLVKTTLRRADLTGATLVNANLLGSHLEEALLSGADLSATNLLWADLSGAVLDGARWSGAMYNMHTHWPEGFDPSAHAMTLID
jgi:uncharacterized protein YjbI with pentapeptide repeats